MRIVPANRLLIQPTVQCKWIEQHKTIEFVLDNTLQQRFQHSWKAYQAQAWLEAGAEKTITAFLDSDLGRTFECHNDDAVFALLAGADFIERKHAGFQIKFGQPNLIWSIERCD